MKKIYLIIALFTLAICLFAQQTGNTLPVKVDFKEGLIVIIIPPPYHTQNIRPMAVPGFVTSIRTMIQQQYTPPKEVMIELLQKQITNEPQITDNEIKLKFAKEVALYIYLSNNNTTNLPDKARLAIRKWNSDADTYAIRNEIGLVNEYITFGDLITETGEAK